MFARSLFLALMFTLFAVISPFTAVATEVAATISVKPALNNPICLKREYTEDHLRENPKQMLSSMYILLSTEKKKVNGERFTLNQAEVYGEKDRELYVNRDSICEFNSDGSAYCFIECDRGSFNLEPRKDNAIFRVTDKYFFALYEKGVSPNKASPRQTVNLQGDDRHNSAYRLYPAPVSECKDIQKRAVRVKSDC